MGVKLRGNEGQRLIPGMGSMSRATTNIKYACMSTAFLTESDVADLNGGVSLVCAEGTLEDSTRMVEIKQGTTDAATGEEIAHNGHLEESDLKVKGLWPWAVGGML